MPLFQQNSATFLRLSYLFNRNQRRRFLMVWVALMAHLAVSGAEPKIMRLAHVFQPDSPSGIGLQAFADKVVRYSQGRMEMKVFPAGQLGSARNIYISSKSGAIDFCVPTFPILADTVPEMTIMTSGYLFDDFGDIERLLDDPGLGQKWNREIIEKSHLRILGAYYYGKRVVTTGNRPFKSPLEAKGLKIRAVPNPHVIGRDQGSGRESNPHGAKGNFHRPQPGRYRRTRKPIPHHLGQQMVRSTEVCH